MSLRSRHAAHTFRAYFSPLRGRNARPANVAHAASQPLARFPFWSPTLLDRLQAPLTRIHE